MLEEKKQRLKEYQKEYKKIIARQKSLNIIMNSFLIMI